LVEAVEGFEVGDLPPPTKKAVSKLVIFK